MKLEMIQQLCTRLSKELGVTYTLRGRDLEYIEAFSDKQLLPGILKSCDQLANLCLSDSFDVRFDETEQSTLGYSVAFNHEEPLSGLHLLIIVDQIMELTRGVRHGKVPLDDLLYL